MGNKIYQMLQKGNKLQKKNKFAEMTCKKTWAFLVSVLIHGIFSISMLRSRRLLAGRSVSRRRSTKSPISDRNPSTGQGTRSSFSGLSWRNVCQQSHQSPILAHLQVLPLGLHHLSPPVSCKDQSLELERVSNGRPKSPGGFNSVVEVAICKPCPFR